MNVLAMSTVRQLLISDASGLSNFCASTVESVIPEDYSTEVRFTLPRASALDEIYRYRCKEIEGFKESRFGWDEFFAALDGRFETVALLLISVNGWRFIVLLDDSASRALACLCSPPNERE